MQTDPSYFSGTGPEPSFTEIKKAFNKAICCFGIAGADAEARTKLVELRRRKFMWFGSEENKLRYAIDRFLRG